MTTLLDQTDRARRLVQYGAVLAGIALLLTAGALVKSRDDLGPGLAGRIGVEP